MQRSEVHDMSDSKSPDEMSAFREGYAAYCEGAPLDVFNPYTAEGEDGLYDAWETGADYHYRKSVSMDSEGRIEWIDDATGKPYRVSH
ncbi:hypothetical protein [Sphingomonas crocodyli]|uniref:Uncharacterized protein n=1 Tax=Sphingomonas crocodyli TaxID=1979270 RepID=A0A437LXH5_9SPHN|nr:hypothetical protein [Sphingomonas crocodyli]RVT90128.1 hypothetical protein EOD43_17615 [Sphingomonas crocodyli]